MTDPKPNGDAAELLWMFKQSVGPKAREVAFDPSDAIYHLYRQTRNPYLERTLAPAARKLERSPQDLQRLFRFFAEQERYTVSPDNAGVAHQRRRLEHPAPPRPVDAAYTVPERLPGDVRRLPWMVDVFFQAILRRLREHPSSFKAVVDELLVQFREEGIRIKIYDAYQTFRNWDELMATLEEIARYPAPETFDLFCSALFAYYELAYPSGSA